MTKKVDKVDVAFCACVGILALFSILVCVARGLFYWFGAEPDPRIGLPFVFGVMLFVVSGVIGWLWSERKSSGEAKREEEVRRGSAARV